MSQVNLLKLCIIDQHTLFPSHTHTHAFFSSSFLISMDLHAHPHAPHRKWWDLNINSMKYSCVSASRSSRTTTKGDLPSDLRILLHSSPLSLPLTLPVVLQHPKPLPRCWVPVCSWVLFCFCMILLFHSQVLLCLRPERGVWGGGGRRVTPFHSSFFTQHVGNTGRAGERDKLSGEKITFRGGWGRVDFRAIYFVLGSFAWNTTSLSLLWIRILIVIIIYSFKEAL